MLYGWCALQFSSVAQILAKPQFTQHVSTFASAIMFSVQMPPAPSPPPAQQTWPAPANPLLTPQPASNPFSFFHPCIWPDGCAFCLLPGHRVHKCPSAQEYVCLGHALVLGDRLSLPNGQPISNDGAGWGLKHGIDTWLAAQA